VKVFIATVMVLAGISSVSAQGNPSGRGSETGDPAASSANPSAAPPQTTTGSSSSSSGSGTSTSGGKDDNMDGGRDKMPESVRTQKERSQQKQDQR
jgi:hypothetical protein